MALVFNGTTVKKLYFNGVECKELYHNGVKVFTAGRQGVWNGTMTVGSKYDFSSSIQYYGFSRIFNSYGSINVPETSNGITLRGFYGFNNGSQNSTPTKVFVVFQDLNTPGPAPSSINVQFNNRSYTLNLDTEFSGSYYYSTTNGTLCADLKNGSGGNRQFYATVTFPE